MLGVELSQSNQGCSRVFTVHVTFSARTCIHIYIYIYITYIHSCFFFSFVRLFCSLARFSLVLFQISLKYRILIILLVLIVRSFFQSKCEFKIRRVAICALVSFDVDFLLLLQNYTFFSSLICVCVFRDIIITRKIIQKESSMII